MVISLRSTLQLEHRALVSTNDEHRPELVVRNGRMAWGFSGIGTFAKA